LSNLLDLKKPSLLVLQPDSDGGPDRIYGWAAKYRVDLTVRNPAFPAEMSTPVEGFDGFIVLGGEMGDGDTEEYPWLEDVRTRLREANQLGIPTLGVCLGGQLLAAALGGKVLPGDQGFETGVVEFRIQDEGIGDPLLKGVPRVFYSGAMHRDAIVRLPEGSQLLVTGERYPHQAFRCGQSWGVQFHPEVSPQSYARWAEKAELLAPGQEKLFEGTAQEFQCLDVLVEPASERLVSNFFEIVRSAGETPAAGQPVE